MTGNKQPPSEAGGIIADGLSLPQVTLPANDIAGLADPLRFDHEDETVLIVGHAETIPRILQSLGSSVDFVIDQAEFDNLFIVDDAASDDPGVVRLRMT